MTAPEARAVERRRRLSPRVRRSLWPDHEGRLPRPPHLWLTAVSLAVVALAGGLTINAVSSEAAGDRRDANHAHDLRNQLVAVELVEWKAIAARAVTPLARSDFDQQLRQLDRTFARLPSGADAGLAEVGVLLHRYESTLRDEFDLLAQNRPDEAVQVDTRQVDPVLERLDSALRGVIVRLDRDAGSEERNVRWAAIAILVLCSALCLVIIRRAGRARLRLAMEHQHHKVLAESEERMRSLLRNSSDGIMSVDSEHRVAFSTPSVAAHLGRRGEIAPGTPLGEVVDAVSGVDLLMERACQAPAQAVRGEWSSGDRQLEVIANDLRGEPTVAGILFTIRDITDRKQLERLLAHRAAHDPLTELANRALFTEEVRRAHSRAQRSGVGSALLFIDLDDFKNVNDALGHEAGDEFLRVVAERIRQSIRSMDLAARLGGDEFAVLLEDTDDRGEAVMAAERIQRALDTPVLLFDTEVRASGSIGISFITARDDAGEILDRLHEADVAMYVAKGLGKARAEVFDSAMRVGIETRVQVRGELERAVRQDELSLYYQPIIELDTGALTGAECLVRWIHPERGLLGADDFIPLAEETGVIVELGRWVLRHACAQMADWSRRYSLDVPISVNVSVRQLESDSVVDDVHEALASSGLAGDRLVLELTESALVGATEHALARLRTLRNEGVRVALDDFGTGYSSLSYIGRLPVDLLKIDRAFVAGVTTDPGSDLVDAILHLARAAGLEPVAEGIERRAQLDALVDKGCHRGQGFHLAEPETASVFEERLAHGMPPPPPDMTSTATAGASTGPAAVDAATDGE